jgi:hypothetical protein
MIFDHRGDDGRKGTLGIDAAGRLYWNGQEVVTRQEVRLSWWVNVSIVIGGFATVVSAAVAVATYFWP